MTDAGKWNFTSDDARHDAIMEEAQIVQGGAIAVAEVNGRATVDAAEANGPVWHWVVFWIALFVCLTLSKIFAHS